MPQSKDESVESILAETIDNVEAHEAEAQAEHQPDSKGEADPFEVEARKSGWVPETEYKGDPSNFVSAKEFVRSGKLFAKIDKEVKARKSLEKQVTELNRYVKHIKQNDLTNKLEDLKAARKSAAEDQDLDAVEALNDEILETKQELTNEKREIEKRIAEDKQALQTWMAENTWYNGDSDESLALTARMDKYASKFKAENPDSSIEEMFEEVMEKMQPHLDRVLNTQQEEEEEEEEIQPVKRTAAKKSKVSTSNLRSGGGGPKKAYRLSDLSPEQQDIARSFEREGIMTKEEYIKDLVERGLVG